MFDYFLLLSCIKRRFDHIKLFTIEDQASRGAYNMRCEVTVKVLDYLINSYQSVASFKNTEKRKRAFLRTRGCEWNCGV